jgi:prepilin-type N-terminal cleavage/methylation domain-containing protein
MQSNKKGFTLIELLVVIAIIAILAAILFPVFAQAKEAAKKTSCLSNFNGVAKAFHLYFGDWDDHMPLVNYCPCSITHCTGSNPEQSNWILDMQPYIANIKYTRCPSDPNATDRGLDRDPVTNLPGANQRERYFNWTTKANHGLNSQYLAPMVRYTTAINRCTGLPQDGPAAINMSRVAQPSETIAILDSIWDRAPSNGAPVDGGNWALDPPCRFYTGGENSFPAIGGVLGIWWFGGWNPTSPTAWNTFGGAFPYHLASKAMGAQTWTRRNEGVVTVSFLDGHSKPLRIDRITAGCDVRNAWGGFIFDRESYIWDLQ